MAHRELINDIQQDIDRYKRKSRLLQYFDQVSTFVIVLLIGLSSLQLFLPQTYLISASSLASLLIFAAHKVIQPIEYRRKITHRIQQLYDVFFRLSKPHATPQDWDTAINDIMEKGLLIEVKPQATIKLVDYLEQARPSVKGLVNTDVSSLELSDPTE